MRRVLGAAILFAAPIFAGGGTQANGTTSGKRQWPDWAALLETAKRVAFNVVIIAAIAVGVPVFVKLVTTRGVVINDITVPSAVADRGLTSDVISRRILDQLHEMKMNAGSKKEQEAIFEDSLFWRKVSGHLSDYFQILFRFRRTTRSRKVL